MAKVQSGSFDRPDSVRRFDHGRVDIASRGESSVGRQVFDPGWTWSLHVKPLAGTEWCEFHHFGVVVAAGCTSTILARATLASTSISTSARSPRALPRPSTCIWVLLRSESAAMNALATVGALAYSLGEPSSPGGRTFGQPVTFIFAFREA